MAQELADPEGLSSRKLRAFRSLRVYFNCQVEAGLVGNQLYWAVMVTWSANDTAATAANERGEPSGWVGLARPPGELIFLADGESVMDGVGVRALT